MNEQKKSNNKKTLIIIILIIILVVCLTTLAVVIFMPKNTEPPREKSKGVVGVITDNWDAEVSQDQQSDQPPKPGTQIPGYMTAEMNEGDMTLRLRIGNPKDNKVGFLATLKLADGTVLYTSPLLKPGQGLEEVPLDRTLEKGTYDALVEYRCVLLDEENTPLNAAESGFKLIVN